MLQIGAGANSKLQARVPYWDLPYYQGMDLVFDAQKGGYRNGSAWGNLLSGLMTDTHAAAINAANGAGVYSSFAPNVLVQNDQGVQTVPTRTNSVRNGSVVGAVVGNPGTLPSNWTSAGGATGLTREIVGTGNSNGLPYVDIRWYGTTTNSGQIGIQFDGNSQIAASSGQVWSGSAFLAIVAGSLTNVTSVSFRGARGYTSGGAASSDASNLVISDLTSSIQRYVNTATLADGTTAFIVPQFLLTLSNAVTIDATFRFAAPQLELGAFATPPILTTGTAATVNGNQPVIGGLNSSLATGFAGFFQVDLKHNINGAVLSIGDGAFANTTIIELSGTSLLRLLMRANSVDQAALNIQNNMPTGIFTLALVVTTNYVAARLVGGSVIGPDTVAVYPAMDRVALGNSGYNIGLNGFQFTRKLALDFLAPGDNPATKFNEVYAKAVLAAAA